MIPIQIQLVEVNPFGIVQKAAMQIRMAGYDTLDIYSDRPQGDGGYCILTRMRNRDVKRCTVDINRPVRCHGKRHLGRRYSQPFGQQGACCDSTCQELPFPLHRAKVREAFQFLFGEQHLPPRPRQFTQRDNAIRYVGRKLHESIRKAERR